MSQTATPVVLKSKEAAELLAFTRAELYSKTVPYGPIPFIRYGKRGKRYLVKDLMTFLESNRVAS